MATAMPRPPLPGNRLARGLLRFAWRSALAIGIAGSGLWGGFGLFYRLPLPDWTRIALAVLWAGLAVAALVALLRGHYWPVAGYAAAFLCVALWWVSLKAPAEADWQPDVARAATATIEGSRLTIHGVRNFNWITPTEAVEKWEDRSYDLDAVTGVDLFFSYWSGPAIAHVIVSFTFANSPPLAFSIETRKTVGQAYSTIAGFFKSYGLVIIAADERDLIRLRTNVRGEDVRLYRLGIGRPNARRLLVAYAEALNRLAAQPKFYNTLRDNCTTLAFGYAAGIWPELAFDWRVLLPGYGPDYAYEIKAVDTSIPLAELKERARIGPAAQAADSDPDFSARIREGVPRPPVP